LLRYYNCFDSILGENSVLKIGIDLGGTKIEGLLLSSMGAVLGRERVPTPSASYQSILEAISTLVDKLESGLDGRATVGVGGPGAESLQSGFIKNSNTQCINGRTLRQDLSLQLDREVRFSNDANCFALSEAVDGAAAAYPRVFGVILGTGVGGGLVFGKQLHYGVNRIAGEWGHNPLPGGDQGRVCYCGRRDCVETYLCGAGLINTYRRLGGESIAVPELLVKVQAGEQCAGDALSEYFTQLARALATVINIVDPDAIVLGGGLSNIAGIYQAVPRLWSEFVFGDDCGTKLLPAKYGDSSGVRGAAWLWNE
jgi:fructokinase